MSILIIGAGQAGTRAALSLRKKGCTEPIHLFGEEEDWPYERPPLSKDRLTQPTFDLPSYSVASAEDLAAAKISVRLGQAVTGLDTHRQEVQLKDGSLFSYSACILAQGGRARAPLLPPSSTNLSPAATQPLILRDAAQARVIREAFWAEPHIVALMGGGFLGLELASSALLRGHQVSISEAAPRLLERFVPPVFSEWLEQWIDGQGVRLSLNAQPSTWENNLQDSSNGNRQTRVAAVGQVARIDLAQQAGLQIDKELQGVWVSEDCRTSDPHVWAIGDIASRPHGWLRKRARLESWENANHQAEVASSSVLGLALPEDSAPWFWTDLFGLNIQILGQSHPETIYRWRGPRPNPDPSTETPCPGFMLIGSLATDQALHQHKEVICHVVAVNAGGDLLALKSLVTRRVPLELEALVQKKGPLRKAIAPFL